MYEVYTSMKPGRPTLLMFMAAGALVLALGVAWFQVRATRVLGAEVSLPDMHLIVRPPAGWIPSKERALFGKVVQKEVWGRRVLAAERTVEFFHNDYFSQFVRMFQTAALVPATKRSIGGFEGVQYILDRQSSQIPGQTILRWAATPGGDLLGIEYNPLAEASPGDDELLDEICRAVRLEESTTRPAADAIPQQAGVAVKNTDGWGFLGPDNQQGPGFWIIGKSGDSPVWAMGIFRRYLGGRRDPMELLGREAGEVWRVFENPQVRHREDGTFVAVVTSPGRGTNIGIVSSVWVIAKSTVETAVVYVLSVPRFADQANQAAAQVAEDLEFTSDYPKP